MPVAVGMLTADSSARDLVGPRAGVEPVGPEQRQRDPLEAEPQARGVGHATVGQLDPVRLREVLLVVVERRDAPSARVQRSGPAART